MEVHQLLFFLEVQVLAILNHPMLTLCSWRIIHTCGSSGILVVLPDSGLVHSVSPFPPQDLMTPMMEDPGPSVPIG